MLGRVIIGGVAVLTSVRYGAGLYFWRVAEKLERPSYFVIDSLADGVELRRYEPYLIAETTVDGVGFRESTASGFRTCAAYIFGKNKSGEDMEKMAMTAPVRVAGNTPEREDTPKVSPFRLFAPKKESKVSFVIGSKYTMKTVPKPIDKKVKIRQVAAHTLAVKTFSGPPPEDEQVSKELKKIKRVLLKRNIKPKLKEVHVYGYHDPFLTPNFLRRNEVAVVVEGNI